QKTGIASFFINQKLSVAWPARRREDRTRIFPGGVPRGHQSGQPQVGTPPHGPCPHAPAPPVQCRARTLLAADGSEGVAHAVLTAGVRGRGGRPALTGAVKL